MADSHVSTYEGLTYATRDDGDLELDLFVPELEDPPLVVYLHGGGWYAGTRDNIPDPERWAAEWQTAIASVSYRLAEVPNEIEANFELPMDPVQDEPHGTFPAQWIDVKASIRWLRSKADEYGFDGTRVALWGSSAGAHLALLGSFVDDIEAFDQVDGKNLRPEKIVAPDESDTVQAVIDWYGPSDLTLVEDESTDAASFLIGGPKSEYEAVYRQVSPVTHASPESPPALIMHGARDEVVSVEHSRQLFEALSEARVDTVYYELHDLNHVWSRGGLDEIESAREGMDLLTMAPTPAQSILEAVHAEQGEDADSLLDEQPLAGPEAIGQFLDRTIK